MRYCPDCKHFVECNPYKMLYNMATKEDCAEFEANEEGGEKDGRAEIRDEH
jgi:hypothetical protein